MDPYEYYTILECSKTASVEEIRRAYHKLALQFHPDKIINGEVSTEKFQQIEEAWRILKDSESKAEYDAECRQAELERENILVYSRITSKELNVTEDKEFMTYQCRCGSNYVVHKEDLEEKNNELHIPCQECTFVIIIET
ncbi:dnaJ homolog subfamily C member 24-like isoform X2 [Cephus cinctus]|uniref:DnaJ homolog subfamily C member 24-like isoform X2 n=1 Tax=Cephus cinctus TaxID=211228 RepID=A0AAJ7BVX4_CEPCN|nr:dnaJ homolog subfamily C member 24-like isoform X2 [Cephus cinctus]XP_024940982.1 dnaJ homolog subfamily C member 24-like isoform X2 [Cephus cinctus]XP_024940983.1 dnaJ homolog subfamily C member 24-like isoform X2 [Cephus cinctus]